MDFRALLTAFLIALASCASVQAVDVILDTILTSPRIWGRDFAVVLAHLKGWQDIGEQSIVIFPDRAVGATPYASRAEAEAAANRLRDALRAPPPQPDSKYLEILKPTAQKERIQPGVIQLGEDGSFRIALTGPPAQLLRPGLTVVEVTSTLGKPTVVTRQVIQTDGERRPVVLTLYSYANGVIVFAESDLSPTAGLIDRVYLRIAPALSRVFK